MLLTKLPDSRLSLQIPSSEKRVHFYERGEEIPLNNQGVWQVHKGVIQLVQLNSQGGQILLGWVHSQGFFGSWLTSLETFQAKALSEVYLQWYSLREVDKNPDLARKILTQVVQRLRQSEDLLAIAGIKKVEDRLWKLLQLLGREIGETKDSTVRLQVRFTHQDLANAIATTRVTVTRILGDLQKKGLISLDKNRHLLIRG